MSDAMMPVVGVRLIEGRTGSTLLMQVLATSEAVVFDERYPAEYRWLSYFARTAEMMTEPFDETVHPGVTQFFFGLDRSWGPVPFRSDVVDPADLGAALLGGMWTAWSGEVRRRHPGAAMYAEKLAVDIGMLVRAGIPLRVIDLVRDPRDVLASIRAFTGSGVEGFGRRAGQSEHDYLDEFIATFRRGVETITATPGDIERRLVRYEDLVTDPEGIGDELSHWLGVNLDPAMVGRQVDRYKHHITSPNPQESLGRWRYDLDATTSGRLTSALTDVMRPLGYDLSAR